MDFFKTMSGFLKSADVTMTIRGGENQLTVSVLPKPTGKDSSTNIQPLILSGTPEELDLFFMDSITKPINEALGIIRNTTEYNDSVQAEEKALADKKREAQKKKDDNAKAKADKEKSAADKKAGTKTSSAKPSTSEDNDEEEDDKDDESVL